MIRDFKNDIELEGESSNSVEATISKENLPFIIDLITRQQYRDPIGSIVREITSNCFDACVEAGNNNPVIISFTQDELGSCIIFKDQGIGMSPQRIKDVYLSYGESTKTLSKDLIGGFGLGGKSPLSYIDAFYVTTISEKVKYEYIVHKGKTLPVIELINEEETTQPNGTEVKIHFVQNNDQYKFIEKVKEQLAYFDNVVFTNTYWFNNKYNIIEGEHFKVRSDIGDHRYSNYVHICIGKVAYPIDFNVLKRKAIPIPIALKFEINDLIVTPERESIRYVEVNGRETINIINEKLDLALNELTNLYKKQDSIVCKSLVEFIERKKEKPVLYIHGISLELESILEENLITYPKIKDFTGTISDDIFYCYTFNYTKFIRNKKKREDNSDLTLDLLKNLTLIRDSKTRVSSLKNLYLQERGNGTIKVGKLKFEGWLYLRKKTCLSLNQPFTTNVIQQLKLIKSVIDGEIKSFATIYDDVQLPQDFIDRNTTKTLKTSLIKKEEDLVVYNLREEKITAQKEYLNPSTIRKYTGFILYGFDTDEFLLKNIAILFKGTRYNDYAVKVLRIAYRTEKYIKEFKNCVHVSKFIGDNKVFKHFATALVIEKESKALELVGYAGKDVIGFKKLLYYILPEVFEDIIDVIKFKEENCPHYSLLDDDFINACVDTAKQYNLLDQEIFEKHQKINTYLDKMELVNHIAFTYDILPYVVEYLALKGKKVAEIWTKPKLYEIALIAELKQKTEYLMEVTQEYEKDYYNRNSKTKTDRFLFLEKQNTFHKSLLNYYKNVA